VECGGLPPLFRLSAHGPMIIKMLASPASFSDEFVTAKRRQAVAFQNDHQLPSRNFLAFQPPLGA